MKLNKPLYALVDPKTDTIVWDWESPFVADTKKEVAEAKKYRVQAAIDFGGISCGRSTEEWKSYKVTKVKLVRA